MRPTARDEDLPFPSTDLYHGLLKPSVKEEDAEIHLSLVVGGSSSFHYLTVDRPNSILHAKIRYTPISDPGLCFTVLDRLSNTHWTTYFPLMEVTANTILPRLYASLVPWQQHVTDPDNLRWCLLGGTANGYDPLPTFELCIIQLHLPTWSIIARRAETYGVTPSPRYGHTATEVGDSSVVVFGGANRKRCLNDMYVLDTNSRVWREIFFSSPVPRRSFHAAVVVRRVEEQQMASFFSGCHFLNPQKKTSSRGEDGKLGKKTSRALVIVGGEDESGALHSVWHCTLNSFTMYEVHFPLLLSPSNFRLQQSDDITGGLPSSDAFRRVVLALMEKETAARQDADGHSVSQPYFSACHGSLLSVVPFYDTADPLSFLTIGGIRSPPVMLVTHLHPTGSSLKESSSLRLSEKGTNRASPDCAR
ncbi:hypothetical protein AGDE_10000 [Angomonas deanei]|uniref:Kelch motif/Galactose oxidase, central domain containing protein, putative n=1 Tax=Angomonas deanei TaxID=59799 RepID=A0A7G2CGC2_9TRYP|nr:hypothetical protein AGDE_10000 [Angomonas deanei]CAD2218796.1 Kelch motif/Galactose oxidase, central domain containing protein, putative [Angomonas deanei]|eukprot:EPY29349.1 hypothetical protein AGDE_10000 [Angomonas deanei]